MSIYFNCYWKSYILLTLFLILFTVTLGFAQSPPPDLTSEKLFIKRTEYFSQTMGVPIQDAKKVIAIMDKAIQDLNNIYNDPTIPSAEKVKRLSFIEKDKDQKIKAIIPDLELRRKKYGESNRVKLKKQK
jgi:hypothetical protein